MSQNSVQKTMLQRAIRWIHQNHLDGHAVPITHRKRQPYPEVTGYFIPTLLSIGEVALAENFARWLVTVQNADGSFAGEVQNQSFVFDTGQVIRGWVSIIDRMPELREPLQRACDWIVRGADPKTGRLMTPASGNDWSLGDRGELSEGVHLYVLKPLRDAAAILGQPEISNAADRALIYYLENVDLTDFARSNMLTHFYGYIQEALFELGYVEEARQGMASVAAYQQSNGAVTAYFDVPWVCSTGLAQLAIVWYLLGDLHRANSAIGFLAQLQNSSGGFFGSYGVGATYFVADEIPWAIKYAIDAEKLGVASGFNHAAQQRLSIALSERAAVAQTNPIMAEKFSTAHLNELEEADTGKSLESNLAPDDWHESITRGTTSKIVANAVRNNTIPPWIAPIVSETEPLDSVLELGSGTGELSAHLARLGRRTTLFDFSHDSLKFATEVFDELGLAGKFVQGDVLQPLPFEDHAIDVIWSSGLLEHFTDQEIGYIISQSARVAKKKVISLVPNASSLAYRLGKDAQERAGRWIWGKEDPKVTLVPTFQLAGLQNVCEYSIATEHALTFMDAPELAGLRSELAKVYAAFSKDSLEDLNQGYLLVTIGDVVKSAADALTTQPASVSSAKRIRRLVCIPNDPLEAYATAGYPDLTNYFNPNQTFDEVYCVSPYESREYVMYGMKVLPTRVADFAARVKELGADCVRAYDIPAGQIACATRVPNVPVICSVHDVNPQRCPGPLPNADYFLAISGAVEKFLLDKGAQSTRILKFGNRVDMEVFRPIYDDVKLDAFRRRFPGRYRVLLVGRRTEQKNLNTLICALALLGEEYTGIFVGQGDAEPYKILARQHNVEARCYFVDAVPNHELAEYYSFSDCFCTPSLWEGFGIVFIEALASEAIIVTSDIAPMNEFITHGQSGLLVPDYEKPVALAKVVQEAIQNKDLRAHIRSNARRAAEPFSQKNIASIEREIYEKVMNKNADIVVPVQQSRIPSLPSDVLSVVAMNVAPKEVAAGNKVATTTGNLSIHMLTRDLESNWESLINNSPDAWFYHSFAEQVLLEEAWPIQTMSFLLEWRGKMVAACPFQRFKGNPTLLQSTNMGPAGIAFDASLSPDERKQVEPIVYKALYQFCEHMGVKQVDIALPPLASNAISAWDLPNPLLQHGFQDRSTVTTVIDLSNDEDEIFRRFATSHKQRLRKTRKQEIEVFRAQGPGAVDDYYALHVETYTRTGVTPHPRPYFEAIYRHFVSTGKAHWFMARYQGRILGVLNLAVFGTGSLYWTGAYSREGLDLGVGRLLQWEAILYAKSIGLRYHETGEIFPNAVAGAKEAGLSEYKRGFGGRAVPFRKGVLTI
jgi:glycosyltransferase involved in cell wall biosynthesis/ubiquinone/menaquinone biosynthesis C-methylase UbiE